MLMALHTRVQLALMETHHHMQKFSGKEGHKKGIEEGQCGEMKQMQTRSQMWYIFHTEAHLRGDRKSKPKQIY